MKWWLAAANERCQPTGLPPANALLGLELNCQQYCVKKRLRMQEPCSHHDMSHLQRCVEPFCRKWTLCGAACACLPAWRESSGSACGKPPLKASSGWLEFREVVDALSPKRFSCYMLLFAHMFEPLLAWKNFPESLACMLERQEGRYPPPNPLSQRQGIVPPMGTASVLRQAQEPAHAAQAMPDPPRALDPRAGDW